MKVDVGRVPFCSMVHCAVGCFVCFNNQEGDTFVYAVHVVWELLQFFLSGHEYAMNITELAERPGDCPEEY